MDTTPTALANPMSSPKAEQAGLRLMREICKRYDDSMRGHYQWLTQQVVQFQRDKLSLLEQTQRNASRVSRTACGLASPPMPEEDVSPSIQAMMPESLRHLLALVLASQDPVEEDTVPEEPQQPHHSRQLQEPHQSQQSKQYTDNAFEVIDEEQPEPALPPTPTSPIIDAPTAPKTIHQCEPTTDYSFMASKYRSTHQAQPSKARRSRKPSKPRKAKKPHKPSSFEKFLEAPRLPSGRKPGDGSGKKLADYFAKKTVTPAENFYLQVNQLQRDRRWEDEEEPLSAPTNKTPWLEPVLPPIVDWEIEATEYVFEYEPFGPGWFVLRCDRGMDLAPITFKSYPLLKSGRTPGLTHFKDETCKHHEHKAYTEETMMVAFARRVVDINDADVTAEWAAESNEDLAEKVQRNERKNARRRERKMKSCVKEEPRHMPVVLPREECSKVGGTSYEDPMFLDDEEADCDDGDELYSLADDDSCGESSQSSEFANDEIMEDDSDDFSI